MTECTSAAVAANTIDSSMVSGSAVSSRGESSPIVTRSASAPGSMRPASGQPRLRVVGGGAQQGLRREVAAALGREPPVELDGAGLLEDVDDGVAVAAEAEVRAGAADAVGEVALRRRAHADRGLVQERLVVGRQVRRVDGGGVRAERAAVREQLRGRAAVGGQARLVLRALLGEMEVQRAAACPFDDGRDLVGGDRPHRMDRGADLRALDGRDALRPAFRVAVAEAALRVGGRLAEAAREIAGVKQREADAGLVRRGDQRVAEVQVVELADARDAGREHLRVCPARQLEARVGRHARRERVHVLAPGPEAAAAALGAAPQRALERVRVRVGEAGERDAAQMRSALARRAGRDAAMRSPSTSISTSATTDRRRARRSRRSRSSRAGRG